MHISCLFASVCVDNNVYVCINSPPLLVKVLQVDCFEQGAAGVVVNFRTFLRKFE